MAGCSKVVEVPRAGSSMVALSRLKSHFSQRHRDLASHQFQYETQYNREIGDALELAVDLEQPATEDTDTPMVPVGRKSKVQFRAACHSCLVFETN